MFAAQENKRPKLSKEKWLQIYLYMDETETFFCFFLDELHEWLSRLIANQGMWRLDKPIVWNLELVRFLGGSESNIAWAMDHWIDHMLRSFVTEFTSDRTISYSEAECRLFKGPRGKYLKSLKSCYVKSRLCNYLMFGAM